MRPPLLGAGACLTGEPGRPVLAPRAPQRATVPRRPGAVVWREETEGAFPGGRSCRLQQGEVPGLRRSQPLPRGPASPRRPPSPGTEHMGGAPRGSVSYTAAPRAPCRRQRGRAPRLPVRGQMVRTEPWGVTGPARRGWGLRQQPLGPCVPAPVSPLRSTVWNELGSQCRGLWVHGGG